MFTINVALIIYSLFILFPIFEIKDFIYSIEDKAVVIEYKSYAYNFYKFTIRSIASYSVWNPNTCCRTCIGQFRRKTLWFV